VAIVPNLSFADLTVSSAFPVDSTKSAVVLPSGPSSIDEDAMGTAGHAAGIAEFDTALKELGLSVPKLARFRPQQAKPQEPAANENPSS
jgi:hypothetical protein